jgi:hypothetical protein
MSSLAVFAVAEPAFAATYHARDGASLQAAVAGADAGSGPSTIELAAGALLPTSTLTITREVTIVGPSSAPGAKLAGSAVEPFPSDLILVRAHAKLTLMNLELTAAGGEGSAAVDDFGEVDLEGSTVAGNNGPGLLVEPGAAATVRNSTLSDGLDAGLVDLGTASLVNATVADNKNGGIEDSGGTLSLVNSIVARNGSADCTRPAHSSDDSLDSDGSCGVGALSRTDPKLGGLTGNGGPTETQALGEGSTAIGAGDDSRCPAEDQRHFARPPGRCDIGAYQTGAVQSALPSAPSTTRPGSAPSSGALTALVGVTGHGTLRGAHRSRIAFSVRAEVGKAKAEFVYTDGARHVVLHALTVKSLAIDGRRGTATLRGNGVEVSSKRRVSITLVLVSNSRQPSLRIRFSSGYYDSGRLLSGAIAFIRGR